MCIAGSGLSEPGAGGHGPPDFGRSVNTISQPARGGTLYPQQHYLPPPLEFPDLPTALCMTVRCKVRGMTFQCSGLQTAFSVGLEF